MAYEIILILGTVSNYIQVQLGYMYSTGLWDNIDYLAHDKTVRKIKNKNTFGIIFLLFKYAYHFSAEGAYRSI
jgi:hypothetical protein